MTVPMFTVHMPDAVDAPLLEILHSGYIGQGKQVERFEERLGRFTGNRLVLTLNSCTSAIQLALRLIGVESGEVISTPLTCSATNVPVIAAGADIVWADIDNATGNIDPADVERRITARTRAILAVDWGGNPCDYSALKAIGARHGIPVVEDAAHAFGARYRGHMIGTVADYTCFSFQAIKHISTGDGGALFVADPEQYRRGKLLRWYGIDRECPRGSDSRIEDDIEEWGYKFHMNDIAATLGLVQMDYVDDIVSRHRDNAAYYDLHLNPRFQRTATPSAGTASAYWLYTILLPSLVERVAFTDYAVRNGVGVSQVHRRNDTYSTFRAFWREGLVGVEEFTARMACIPVHWRLSKAQREHVVRVCNSFAATRLRAPARGGSHAALPG